MSYYMQQPYVPMNTMMNAQQRLNMLEQQYPQFAQQNQMYQNNQNQMQNYNNMQQQMPVLKGRPVASYDEAKAAMIDLDGSVFYFIDNANRKIYTKQINLDGTASIYTFVREDVIQKQMPQPQKQEEKPTMVQGLTINDLELYVRPLAQRVAELEQKLSGGILDVQSNASTTNVKRKSNANDEPNDGAKSTK